MNRQDCQLHEDTSKTTRLVDNLGIYIRANLHVSKERIPVHVCFLSMYHTPWRTGRVK